MGDLLAQNKEMIWRYKVYKNFTFTFYGHEKPPDLHEHPLLQFLPYKFFISIQVLAVNSKCYADRLL